MQIPYYKNQGIMIYDTNILLWLWNQQIKRSYFMIDPINIMKLLYRILSYN